MHSALCLDVGGTSTKYAVVQEGRIIYQNQKTTCRGNSVDFFEFLKELINEVEEHYLFEAIGISFPGFINTKTGEAMFAGALNQLHGQNIKMQIEKLTGSVYPVYIENDANCAAMAEKLSGNAVKNSDFVVITIGTGIGGGIFVNDKILHGLNYRAGEFGMMLLDFSCHPKKVYSELASTQTLIYEYKKLYQISESEEISGKVIFEKLNDPTILHLVTKWCNYIACGIVNVVSVLNPEKILIGGGVSANPKLLPLIEKSLEKIHFWKDLQVPVEHCRYLNDAGLLGAYYLTISNR